MKCEYFVFVALIILILVGFVSASSEIISYPNSVGGTNGEYYDYEYDLNLGEGWNLVSFGENFPYYMNENYIGENIPIYQKVMDYSGPYADSQDEEDAPLYAYVYDWVKKEYVRVYPGNMVDNYLDEAGGRLYSSAMWVYVKEPTRIKYFVPNVPKLEDTSLTQGWNLVAITPEMGGKSINQIKGNCDLERIYAFEEGEWVSLINNLDDGRMLGENSAQGHGMAIKTGSDCTLGTSTEGTSAPPSLPGLDNIEDFPGAIGNYELKGHNSADGGECGIIEGEEICVGGSRYEYVSSDDMEVDVIGIKVTKNKQGYINYIKSYSLEEGIDTVGGVYLWENGRELYWFTQSGEYDAIGTQVYERIPQSDGSIDMNALNATTTNQVVKYFLNKYPPTKV